jgi:predicted amidophosphoribosyltransferase
MDDGLGYPICQRCRKRIDLEDDTYCVECAELVAKEEELEDDS